jgi:hypothetical protein
LTEPCGFLLKASLVQAVRAHLYLRNRHASTAGKHAATVEFMKADDLLGISENARRASSGLLEIRAES